MILGRDPLPASNAPVVVGAGVAGAAEVGRRAPRIEAAPPSIPNWIAQLARMLAATPKCHRGQRLQSDAFVQQLAGNN